MNHFYKSIDGWFDFNALYTQQVYRAANGAHFVEVGAWKGKSTAFMAVEIASSGKKIKFDVVDHWLGSLELMGDAAVKDGTLYDVFMENLKPAAPYFTPIRMPSVQAASLYRPESLDFVFLDGSHEYADVMEDMCAWYPLVKPGGTLAGHDIACPDVSKAVSVFLGGFPEVIGSCWSHTKATGKTWQG